MTCADACFMRLCPLIGEYPSRARVASRPSRGSGVALRLTSFLLPFRPACRQLAQSSSGTQGIFLLSGQAPLPSIAADTAHGSGDDMGVVPPARLQSAHRTSRECIPQLGGPPHKPLRTKPRLWLQLVRPCRVPSQRHAKRGELQAEREQDEALRHQEEDGRRVQTAGQHRRQDLVVTGWLLHRCEPHELGRPLTSPWSYVSPRCVCDERLRAGHAATRLLLG